MGAICNWLIPISGKYKPEVGIASRMPMVGVVSSAKYAVQCVEFIYLICHSAGDDHVHG